MTSDRCSVVVKLVEQTLQLVFDILCVQEAEIKYDDPQDLLEIPGYNIEIEQTRDYFSKRTIMYIRSNISYKRRITLEKEEAHIILITLECGVGLAAIYRTR